MSRLSNTINNSGIPDEYQKQLSTCFFCGETITKGGCWAGQHHIGVCSNCSYFLIDLFIDTCEDSGEFKDLEIQDKLKVIQEISGERLLKKAEDLAKYKRRIEKMKSDKECMKKVGFKYYAEMGIIDIFNLTMTASELKQKINESESPYTNYIDFTSEDIDACINEITKIINDDTGESPHTIRFFAIPNFSYSTFDLGCVAKIDNNGSTFIFASNKQYFNAFDVYHSSIKEIY